MTEEKKLPTIEEWFEENKNENDCAGMTVVFLGTIGKVCDDAVNGALKDYFSDKIFREDGLGNTFIETEVTLDLVLSKDKDGRIVYFIDESRVELV
jgi:hypothetical protein